MATYESVCKLTNKKEKISFDVIPMKTFSNPSGLTVGLMKDCTVRKRTNCDLCKECNLYRDIQNTYKYL
jgi:hypothetical protein